MPSNVAYRRRNGRRHAFRFSSDDPADYKPLEAYGIIGDSRTAALVGADGSIDWACLPDFDSPSVFGALLDPSAGCFAIRPAGDFRAEQYYEPGTNVLVTEFETGSGTARVRDFMPYSQRKVPTAEIYRRVEGVKGTVTLEVVFAPRFDYGMTAPRLEPSTYGVRASDLDGQAIVLSTEFPIEVEDDRAVGRAEVHGGQEAYVVAAWGAERVHPVASYQSDRRLWNVRKFWREWIDGCPYHGRYRETVERSLLALKLLIYEPTGAIVAAPTMSLPEWPGGERNWDYRYSWVRDSAFILQALFGSDYVQEGTAYFDWILSQALDSTDDLGVMYSIRGERELPESTLPLRGYRDSQPVRIGNGAAEQHQLDVYGSLLDAALRYDRQGGLLTITEWEKLSALADAIREHWQEPDDGIWEARNGPRHYTYSKVWAWVGLTRAATLAEKLGADAPSEAWRAEAETIREQVLDRAWDDERGAFMQTYECADLDASVLVMPTVGFLPASDPRFLRTLYACLDELGAGPEPLVYRYRNDDGVGGKEGAFLLPSFWVVEGLALAGDERRARALLSTLIEHMSPLGLYAEEIHPDNGSLLGNFPQGFSHLGLLNAVFRLERLKQEQTRST